jgi:hypothetical protein
MAKKMKIDKKESKKEKSAKGTKKVRKRVRRIIVGGLIIFVAIGAFTRFGNFTNGDNETIRSYEAEYKTSHGIIIYERGMPDPDPENLEDLYVLVEDDENSLIRIIDGKKEDDVTLLCGNGDISEIDLDSDNVYSLLNISLIESLLENGEIDSQGKFADMEMGANHYTIFIRKDSVIELLNDKNCIDPIRRYTTPDGETHKTLEEFLIASHALQNSSHK